MFSDQNQEQLAGRRRQEEECLGVYAASVQLYTRRGYQDFSAAVREDLALQAFLRQHVRLTRSDPLCGSGRGRIGLGSFLLFK